MEYENLISWDFINEEFSIRLNDLDRRPNLALTLGLTCVFYYMGVINLWVLHELDYNITPSITRHYFIFDLSHIILFPA